MLMIKFIMILIQIKKILNLRFMSYFIWVYFIYKLIPKIYLMVMEKKRIDELPNFNKSWIEFMSKEFKLIILGNGYGKEIKEFAHNKKIPCIWSSEKISETSLLCVCDEMGLEPENVLLIGNRIHDIYAGNKAGLVTANVKNVNKNDDILSMSKPQLKIKEVKEIDYEFVKEIKRTYGIGGIILDVDDTIRKQMFEVPDCNQKWIEFMRKEFKLIILSNGFSGKIKEFCDKKGIPYIGFAKKPLKTGFLRACNEMGLEPQNVLVIGNSTICDIYGGNRSGLITASVEKVKERNEFTR